jgi:hypothetical protein
MPSCRTSIFSVSNFFPLTNMLPNPVTVPDADADALPPAPPALADADGEPSLQALKNPANPTAPRRANKTDDGLIATLLFDELMIKISGLNDRPAERQLAAATRPGRLPTRQHVPDTIATHPA